VVASISKEHVLPQKMAFLSIPNGIDQVPFLPLACGPKLPPFLHPASQTELKSVDTLKACRWRQHVSPKCWCPSTRLRDGNVEDLNLNNRCCKNPKTYKRNVVAACFIKEMFHFMKFTILPQVILLVLF
jgi:hypothetical protein